jgi:hypothetical protein
MTPDPSHVAHLLRLAAKTEKEAQELLCARRYLRGAKLQRLAEAFRAQAAKAEARHEDAGPGR